MLYNVHLNYHISCTLSTFIFVHSTDFYRQTKKGDVICNYTKGGDNVKNRIKEIRKVNNLTQTKMAEVLGISLSNIQSYETGRRTPSDAVIQLLCNKFNVNETWLLTGNGEMSAPMTDEQRIGQILANYIKDDNFFLEELTRIVVSLSPETIKELTNSLIELAKNLEKHSHPDE